MVPRDSLSHTDGTGGPVLQLEPPMLKLVEQSSYASDSSLESMDSTVSDVAMTDAKNDSGGSSSEEEPTESLSSDVEPSEIDDGIRASKLPERQTTISFGSIQVREYELVLGDNPDVKVGPPISLGWSFVEHEQEPLDEYETRRNANRIRRPNLRMSSITRKNLLRNVFGVSEEEIAATEKEIQRIQKRRASSAKQSDTAGKVETALQSTRRRMRRVFSSENFFRGLSGISGHMMPVMSGSSSSNNSMLIPVHAM
jgi:hypothetical protein